MKETVKEAGVELDCAASVTTRFMLQAGVLRGHVPVGTVGVATGAGAARTAPLIALTVAGKNAE